MKQIFQIAISVNCKIFLVYCALIILVTVLLLQVVIMGLDWGKRIANVRRKFSSSEDVSMKSQKTKGKSGTEGEAQPSSSGSRGKSTAKSFSDLHSKSADDPLSSEGAAAEKSSISKRFSANGGIFSFGKSQKSSYEKVENTESNEDVYFRKSFEDGLEEEQKENMTEQLPVGYKALGRRFRPAMGVRAKSVSSTTPSSSSSASTGGLLPRPSLKKAFTVEEHFTKVQLRNSESLKLNPVNEECGDRDSAAKEFPVPLEYKDFAPANNATLPIPPVAKPRLSLLRKRENSISMNDDSGYTTPTTPTSEMDKPVPKPRLLRSTDQIGAVSEGEGSGNCSHDEVEEEPNTGFDKRQSLPNASLLDTPTPPLPRKINSDVLKLRNDMYCSPYVMS